MAHPTIPLTSPLTSEHKSSATTAQPTVSLTSFEELLDLRQAARLLGMHWKTLEIMARGRRVPALKVGKRWRFRLSSLNRWLDDEIDSNTTNHAALTGKD